MMMVGSAAAAQNMQIGQGMGKICGFFPEFSQIASPSICPEGNRPPRGPMQPLTSSGCVSPLNIFFRSVGKAMTSVGVDPFQLGGIITTLFTPPQLPARPSIKAKTLAPRTLWL